MTKTGSGELVLSGGGGSGFLGSTVVEAGRLVVSNATALGTGNSIAVNDGASLVLQSGGQFPNEFQFDKSIRLGSASTTQGGGVLELSLEWRFLFIKGDSI